MHERLNIILAGLIGIIVGVGGSIAFFGVTQKEVASSEHVLHGSSAMQQEMDGMMQTLEGKTGDAFDQAFLSEMIAHHEGAVSMAEAALQNAQHVEIRELAEAILSAQVGEIVQMQNWQKLWYGQ